jgi:transcriptional regulator with XRE-family HTH domain
MAKSQDDRRIVAQVINEMGSEKYVVERIRAEVKAHGWSLAELSRRMNESSMDGNGGVIDRAVLSKMLGGDRGRHVSIDQLITLSKVFGIPLGELLVPASTLANIQGWRYVMEAGEIQNEIRSRQIRYDEQIRDVRRMLQGSPELRDRLREYRDGLREKLEQQVRGMWRGPVGDFRTEPTEEELAEEMRGYRYPALKAVEDALEEGERDE